MIQNMIGMWIAIAVTVISFVVFYFVSQRLAKGGLSWYDREDLHQLATMLTFIMLVGVTMSIEFGVYTDKEIQRDYDEALSKFQSEFEQEKAPYEMGVCDWKLYFRDAAYNSKLRFWRGGDEERGELSLYYQAECKDNPAKLDSLTASRSHHPYMDEYRTTGKGGWNGTYPAFEY